MFFWENCAFEFSLKSDLKKRTLGNCEWIENQFSCAIHDDRIVRLFKMWDCVAHNLEYST